MENRLVVVGIQEENLFYLKTQIEHIFERFIPVKGITLKDLKYNSIQSGDLVLLTTQELQALVDPFLPDTCNAMVAERTINIVNLKHLMGMDVRKNILIVNVNQYSTLQTLKALESILPNHSYYPYSVQKELPQNIDFVITPGESHLIPEYFPQIMDIGPRVIAFETLVELKNYFHLKIDDSLLMQLYIKTMVYLTIESDSKIPVTLNNQNQHREFSQICTNSPLMAHTLNIAKQIAKSPNAVHIEGEVGTGKQMLAEMIHNASSFSMQPFYIYNCADKDPQMIDEELFGNKDKSVEGIIDSISGGTLYIKNIDHLPYLLQGKLFHLIDFHGGDSKASKIRIITASINSLSSLFHQGLIRTDIYSYLSSYVLKVPSLTDRKEDIALLIDSFKEHVNKIDLKFSDRTMAAFLQYDWPGNIRELYNLISYCACLHDTYIEPEALPLFFKGMQRKANDVTTIHNELDFKHLINEIENHGFLSESIHVLQIFQSGKQKNESYGRGSVKKILSDKDIVLTDQQLRLRIEVLNNLGLLKVRIGRAGTTITEKGEHFLQMYDALQNI